MLRKQFVQQNGFSTTTLDALPQDASFRRYFRVRKENRTALLMDAPPKHENILPFVTVADHLVSLGLNAPIIYVKDIENGFALIEDFGDDTFTRLLAQGVDESRLYEMAIDVLCHLHKQAGAKKINLPKYDTQRLLDEAVLFVDWFYLAHRGEGIDSEAHEAFLESWREILYDLPAAPQTLVLRDYHVDNLMRINRNSVGDDNEECGLLDFQDAVIGPTAYDVVSLLEDARRDISPELTHAMQAHYFKAFPNINQENFEQWYAVLGAQRHCKVAGIFVRLCLRDDKCHYFEHIPRVTRLLGKHINKPVLAPLNEWLQSYLPEWQKPLPRIRSQEKGKTGRSQLAGE
ncbi:MAG: phosphotransferase [Gammaproteobacteria bacterium]|nr:phosphotransferase [Gammaproteobacteria bacterium]